MRRARTAGLLLFLTPFLGGCGGFVPFEWGEGTSWARARQLAYLREEAGGERDRPFAAGPGRHLVMPGDTVSGLAQRYGVPMAQIIRLNGLKPPYRIYVGQVLEIGPPPAAAGRQHIVQRGETLSHIALRYGLRLDQLIAANPGIEPERLLVGQPVRLPPETARPVAVAENAASSSKPAAEAATGDATSPPPQATAATARRAAEVKAPPLSPEGFLWPVEGRIIDRFGAKPNGQRNDGVNIEAPEGTPVRAAESGVVVYAGESIPAFGRMLMLRHAGGLLTAYAHNRTLLVTVGDVVQRGQVIARVGATGDVSRPQLHFQIRKGTEPVDPVAFLGQPRQFAQR